MHLVVSAVTTTSKNRDSMDTKPVVFTEGWHNDVEGSLYKTNHFSRSLDKDPDAFVLRAVFEEFFHLL